MGVTGSGKTFTIANVVASVNKPTLVISHNKTLAAQLYQEFKEFFPENAVSFFVSYYDFYQPEAYIPQTDTYIEKETEINEEIDKLRLQATTNLLTRPDSLIVASVSCIYNLGDPRDYGRFILELSESKKIGRNEIIAKLIDLQYERSDFGFHRSTFRVMGDCIDVFLAYEQYAVRIQIDFDSVLSLTKIDPLTGKIIERLDSFVIYPAKHYVGDFSGKSAVFDQIRKDLNLRVSEFNSSGKILEAHRLKQKVDYDLEMIEEMGYVNGIENYSRYFDGRSPGDPPYTLIDYFNQPYAKDWLLIVDESHMTLPQVRGMYNGDRARKETLIKYGFRLPAALDNRPLKFQEFMDRVPQTIHLSATPNDFEIQLAKNSAKKQNSLVTGITEQLIRPTAIVDPKIEIRSSKNQLIDLISEIIKRKKVHQRVLVTTLTKRMAEDLTQYLEEEKYRKFPQFAKLTAEDIPKVQYLHSDIITLRRSDILDDLRNGTYDCLIGINLLREGLDLPEVSLVVILDADKEGFLRSKTTLIQTFGRAARHLDGEVILYADNMTKSMANAISEIERRRKIQLDYNKKHALVARKIVKPIREKLVKINTDEIRVFDRIFEKKLSYRKMLEFNNLDLTPLDRKKLIKKLEIEMKTAALDLQFELAAALRDKIKQMQ